MHRALRHTIGMLDVVAQQKFGEHKLNLQRCKEAARACLSSVAKINAVVRCHAELIPLLCALTLLPEFIESITIELVGIREDVGISADGFSSRGGRCSGRDVQSILEDMSATGYACDVDCRECGDGQSRRGKIVNEGYV